VRFLVAAGAALALGASLAAQNVPDISFDSNADLLQTPKDVFVGEIGGVGANSKGQIFVYTRTGHPYATIGDNRTFARGGSKLFQFDQTGKFVRELGQDVYGFNAAIGLRVDPQDNVWTIDSAASQVVKFDADGRVALVLGRKPETIAVRAGAPGAGRGGPEGGGRGAEAGRGAGAPGGAPGGPPPARLRPAAAVAAEAVAVRQGRAFPAPPSAVRPTWRGIAPATSTSRTASAPTTASRNSTRTATFSSSGDRQEPSRDSSTA
jgi:hypothetical protein